VKTVDTVVLLVNIFIVCRYIHVKYEVVTTNNILLLLSVSLKYYEVTITISHSAIYLIVSNERLH